MKARVRMTETAYFYVEGDSEDQIQEWLETHSISEAKEAIAEYSGKRDSVEMEYSEEVICPVDERGDADISISKKSDWREVSLDMKAIVERYPDYRFSFLGEAYPAAAVNDKEKVILIDTEEYIRDLVNGDDV